MKSTWNIDIIYILYLCKGLRFGRGIETTASIKIFYKHRSPKAIAIFFQRWISNGTRCVEQIDAQIPLNLSSHSSMGRPKTGLPKLNSYIQLGEELVGQHVCTLWQALVARNQSSNICAGHDRIVFRALRELKFPGCKWSRWVYPIAVVLALPFAWIPRGIILVVWLGSPEARQCRDFGKGCNIKGLQARRLDEYIPSPQA